MTSGLAAAMLALLGPRRLGRGSQRRLRAVNRSTRHGDHGALAPAASRSCASAAPIATPPRRDPVASPLQRRSGSRRRPSRRGQASLARPGTCRSPGSTYKQDYLSALRFVFGKARMSAGVIEDLLKKQASPILHRRREAAAHLVGLRYCSCTLYQRRRPAPGLWTARRSASTPGQPGTPWLALQPLQQRRSLQALRRGRWAG